MFQVIFIFFSLLFYSIAANSNGNEIIIRESDLHNFFTRQREFLRCNGIEYEVEAEKPVTITGYASILKCNGLGGKLMHGIQENRTYEVEKGPKRCDTWVCTIERDQKVYNIYLRMHTTNTNDSLNFVNHYIVRNTKQSQDIQINFNETRKITVWCRGSDDDCDVMKSDKKTGYTLRRLHEWQYPGDYSEAEYVKNVYFMNVSNTGDPYEYKFAILHLSCDYCGKEEKQKATNLSCLAKQEGNRIIKVEIHKIFNHSDGDDESSRSTISSTIVATTYPEATTTSTTEKVYIDDTGTSRPTISSTSVATTYSEGTTTSMTEKPLDIGIIPVNNKLIAAAVAVPMLAVFVCILTVLYKRKKLNQHTWFFRRGPQNEYDYCVVNPVNPPNPEQLVYDYAVPDGPVSEGVMCENTLYTGFYSKVIPKSQRKGKNKLHVYANSSLSDKIKANAGVGDPQSENTPNQKSINKRNTSKSVHSNLEHSHKSDKNDDSELNTLYASAVDRINRTCIENSDIASSNNKLVNIVYSEPLDKKVTADTDTYTNVTDGPHYSNKIGGYCVYPTYSEPNVKK